MKLPYLQGYPPDLLAQVRALIDSGRLAQTVASRHPEAHNVRTERALYDYVNELKSRHMDASTTRPAPISTPPMSFATRSPSGANRSAVTATVTAAIARQSITPITRSVAVSPAQDWQQCRPSLTP